MVTIIITAVVSLTFYHAIAFLVHHSEYLPKSPKVAELQQYVTGIDNLEYMTGIDFFCNLADKKDEELKRTFSLNDCSW